MTTCDIIPLHTRMHSCKYIQYLNNNCANIITYTICVRDVWIGKVKGWFKQPSVYFIHGWLNTVQNSRIIQI